MAGASAAGTSVGRKKYWAFISYSHRDAQWGNWLHKVLETYRPPRTLIGTTTATGIVPKRLAPIFRDREELASATDLGTVINAALENSGCQIVICSPNSARSRWVNEEILAFKRLGREDRIYCLIVDGEPNATDMPGREAEECFPPALRFRLGTDGQLGAVRTEPIAADARPGKDGKLNAKLKLIAGLLGVGFDVLRRREQQRRMRQLIIIAIGALAGMIVTTGLAAYALVQRGAAQRQAQRALAETRTARATARFLVDLFRISDPGEARGNAITAREMLDKGAERINQELATEPAVRATLMGTLGSVYTGLGLYDKAAPLLNEAVATRQSLPGIDPLDLAESLNSQGDLPFLRNELDGSEKAYQAALRLARLNDQDPRAKADIAATLHGLGSALLYAGQNAEAQQDLRAALALQQELHGTAHADIARTQKDLADAVERGGDLGGAIALLEQAVAMQRQLWGSEPHPDFDQALNDLAGDYQQQGDYDKAEPLFRESLAMKRRLYGEKHPEVATGLANLASSLQDKGDLAAAEPLYQESLAMSRELLGHAHPYVAAMLHNLASLQFDRGETGKALANERQALDIRRRAYKSDHADIAISLNVLGTWLTFSGAYDEAQRHLDEALVMRQRLFKPDNPAVGSSLAALANLEVAQGRYPEALENARRAKAIFISAFSPDHWRTAIAEGSEGGALLGLHRYSEAEPLLTHSVAILSKDGGAPVMFKPQVQHYLDQLHRAHRARR